VRVLAAMSGGVDSAVAAARAVDSGHDVTGVHLALSRDPAGRGSGSRGCCSVADAHDARRACDALGVPFYIWDMAERFAVDVIEDFTASYAAGRTPNPCIRCNERIKFSALLDRALALGFDALVTGHYARRVDAPDGPALHRAADLAKDQSYVLSTVRRDRLARALFPIGDSHDKDDVRAEAAARGLSVAAKPDSNDICFIPDGDTAQWLTGRIGAAPGPVVDTAGREVGRHHGAYAFTVGQRRGLALDRPAHDGRPRYVLSIEPVTRTVTVGGVEEMQVTRLVTGSPSWRAPPPQRGSGVLVQTRAHGRPQQAVVTALGEAGITLDLEHPIPAVAPGQTVALYEGARVLCGATLVSCEGSAT